MSYRGEQKIKDRVYVYEAVAIWNPQKKRSEQKRIYIGRKDPDTGAFIPNKKYEEIEAAKQTGLSADEAILAMFSSKTAAAAGKTSSSGKKITHGEGNRTGGDNSPGKAASADRKAVTEGPAPSADGPMAADGPVTAAAPLPVSAAEYGRTSTLRQLAKSCGLINILQQTLPGTGKKLLDHVISGKGTLPVLEEFAVTRFFQEWISHCGDLQYLSLYTELKQFYPPVSEYTPSAGSRFRGSGTMDTPQLMVLYGADSELPVYFRCEEKTQSSIQDVITGFAFLRPLDLLQVQFCFQEDIYTDRGLYLLLQHGFRFTAHIPLNAGPAASLLRGFDPEDHHDEITATIGGRYFRIQSRRTMVNGRDVYCHICCDTRQRQLAQARLLHHICSLEKKVSDGTLQMTDASVRRYLSFDRRSKEGWICSRRTDVIREELRYAGCFILLSNAETNAVRALKSSLDQSDIKNAFDRPHASVDAASGPSDIQGKDPWPSEDSVSDVFCSFLELILHAYLRRKLQVAISEGRLDSSCTPEGILDELSEIRRIIWTDGSRTVTQLTQRQEVICEALGVQIR